MIKRNTMYVTRDIDGLFLWKKGKPELIEDEISPGNKVWKIVSEETEYEKLDDDACSMWEVPMGSIRELIPIIETE